MRISERADHEHRNREAEAAQRPPARDRACRRARSAASVPSGRPKSTASRLAATISSSVRGRRSAISSRDRVIVQQRAAEIARAAGRRHSSRYCVEIGRSRPSFVAQLRDRRGIRRDAALGEQELRRIARDEVDDEEDERSDHPDRARARRRCAASADTASIARHPTVTSPRTWCPSRRSARPAGS